MGDPYVFDPSTFGDNGARFIGLSPWGADEGSKGICRARPRAVLVVAVAVAAVVIVVVVVGSGACCRRGGGRVEDGLGRSEISSLDRRAAVDQNAALADNIGGVSDRALPLLGSSDEDGASSMAVFG